MNKIITKQLDRVEIALTTLIDSITSYNPSLPAAQELLSADDALTSGLEQLTIHQTNHQRILSLRETANTLDTNMKSTLTLLAQTRQEILDTPATSFSATQRQVPYTELVNYAKNISKYTIPPTSRPKPPPPPISEATELPIGQASNLPLTQQTGQTVLANGISNSPSEARPQEDTNVALNSLSAPELAWLEALSSQAFTPWPNDDLIRQSALAQIQGMLERGEDPYGEPGAKGKELAQGQEGAGEEHMEGIELRDEGRNGRGMDKVERVERVEKPKVFALDDLYDPDAE